MQIYLVENSLSKEKRFIQPEFFVHLTKPTFCLYIIYTVGEPTI